MSHVITFENVQPSPRYDGIPWTEVAIQEAPTEDAAEVDWVTIDSFTLTPVDTDPELPAARDLTTENGSDDEGLWYRLVFSDANGDQLLPTTPIQNVVDAVTSYATVAELARILKIRVSSDEQRDAMDRVLLVAAGEIDHEIDLADDVSLTSWQLALAQEVNLERAVEHWRQQESPFGLIALGVDVPAERSATDSWNRHAAKLAPLKNQWGMA